VIGYSDSGIGDPFDIPAPRYAKAMIRHLEPDGGGLAATITVVKDVVDD